MKKIFFIIGILEADQGQFFLEKTINQGTIFYVIQEAVFISEFGMHSAAYDLVKSYYFNVKR